MSSDIEIPLFPLNAVLFPGGSLPLRIFEARYIDLVRNCMRSGSGFGIVLILEGPEARTWRPAVTCAMSYSRKGTRFIIRSSPEGTKYLNFRGTFADGLMALIGTKPSS